MIQNGDGTFPDGDTDLGLTGKVALITGASRGLGLAIATKLCRCGCDVFLNYASSDADAERAIRSLDELKGSASIVKGDISERSVLNGIIDQIFQEYDRLDVFVHNAASYHPMSALSPTIHGVQSDLQMAVEPLLWAASLLNATGRDVSRIIAISSLGAQRVIPGYVSLGMAKAALESLVRYLAVELAPKNTAVNALSTSKLDKRSAAELAGDRRLLADRLTTTEDVADVVALLCTSEAAWIRGQVITVDGGARLKP